MIISIGIDIVEVARVRRTLERTPRFAERVFTEGERRYCENRGAMVRAVHYAARFAAKEAAMKALRTGWTSGVKWQEIEVVSEPSGAPSLVFHGQTQALLQQRGARAAHLSMSHTTQYAIAEVILEGKNLLIDPIGSLNQ